MAPFVIVTVDTVVKGAVHALFAYTLYWTVPPAWKKPARVDESVTVVPTTGVVEERLVVIVELAWLTVRGSHALMAPLLFVSPK